MRVISRFFIMRAGPLAAIVLALAAIALVAATRLECTGAQSYSTSVGENLYVALDPRATAHLNTNTEISVTLTPEHCDITLNRGEVMLEIRAGDSGRVRVQAGNVIMRADTSTFSVRVRDRDHVDVLVRDGDLALTAREKDTFTETRVGALQSAQASPSGLTIRTLSSAETARHLGWTAGILWFEGESLEQATQEFNRYNARHLVVEDPNIRQLRVGGRFRCTEPERFVQALHSLGVRQLTGDSREPAAGPIRLVGTR